MRMKSKLRLLARVLACLGAAAHLPAAPVPELVRRFAVTDVERVDAWRRRLRSARASA